MSNNQESTEQSQPLKLTNPTPYHIMASSASYSTHPLTELEFQQHPHQLGNFQLYSSSKESPQQRNSIDFSDMMNSISSPLSNDFEEHYDSRQSFLHDRSSFSSVTMNNPMDIHRRSSTATDVSFQQSVFIPGSNLNSNHPSLAMSAPANMGFDYCPTNNFQTSNNNHSTLSFENNTSSASTNNSLARSYDDDYTMQMNMQMMMEKRRRRRESHNAVERRRRDNINERIQELCELLPESAMDNMTLGPNNKPNKGVILKKSVDHIKQLQQELQAYRQRAQELENTLKTYQQKTPL